MQRSFRERLGELAGVGMAPITGALSAIRQARMFHPRGEVWRADVEALPGPMPWSALGARVDGWALVRLSGAWWKDREWKDVLGCALRFTRSASPTSEPEDGDQDLLLATIRRPWTMPFAPLTTNPHDFLSNDYYGVSPFQAPGTPSFEWRLRPEGITPPGRDRYERLARAVADGEARFVLEVRPYRRIVDVARRRRERFRPVARVVLRERLEVDQDALRFDPFRAGRGIQPVGFVNALRVATYASSQHARPQRAAGAEGTKKRRFTLRDLDGGGGQAREAPGR